MKYLYNVVIPCFFILFSLSACQMTDAGDLQPDLPVAQKKAPMIEYGDGSPIEDQYIVVFQEQAIQHPQLAQYPNDEARTQTQGHPGKRDEIVSAQQLMKRNGIMRQEVSPLMQRHQLPESCVKSVFTGRTKGAVMKLNASQLASLQDDDEIAFIEQDRIVALSISPVINTPFMPSQTPESGQVAPYGISRVGGSVNFIGSPFYIYRWAWIIDTGIDIDHPDLNVDAYFAANFTTDPGVDDQHGHGTHVAGIVAARDNGIGTRGVAAGAVVVPIKVLKNDGTGSVSDLIAGLNYVGMYAWPDDVVNVSLGGGPSLALDSAILAIAQAGIKVVIASGNSGLPVSNTSPARVNHPKVFTVAAIDNNDHFAEFSNYGPGVDYVAPGVDILSTFKNGEYAYVSGTSMAAPHMTGVLIATGNSFGASGTSSADPTGRKLPVISQ